MPDIGVPELLIVAFIVVLLFGPAKAAGLGGSLGKSIREFRKATHEDSAVAPGPEPLQMDRVSAAAGRSAPVRFCTECGAEHPAEAKFCTNCGHAMGS